MSNDQPQKPPASIARVGTHMVLSLKEALTHANCGALETMIGDLIQENKPWIILDLKAVPVIDSRGLESLLKIEASMQQRGSRLKMVGLGQVCRDILMATRLSNVFHVYEDIHKAIQDKT